MVRFGLSDQDEEDLRWYLEDYLQEAIDPAPVLAGRVETKMVGWGRELFSQVFAGKEGQRLWKAARRRLASLDVVISTDVWGESLLWELLTDPETGRPLAGFSRSFTRAGPPGPTCDAPPGSSSRFLLVIARPAGADDVSFASVGSQLVRLCADAEDVPNDETGGSGGAVMARLFRRRVAAQGSPGVLPFQLDVLRPATLDQLERVLLLARDRGAPYQVVHIDAHGVRAPGKGQRAPRGYIVLEDPSSPRNRALVDGARVGELLAAAQVQLLVLNACRSAGSEPAPRSVEPGQAMSSQTGAYGSFAREAVDAGVPGVVAMRFAVYVSAAERLVASLYGALLRGKSLGEAVTACRADLAGHPLRRFGVYAHEIQDWVVPVGYGNATTRLPTPVSERDRERHRPPSATPLHGFCGRDDVLFELDRGLQGGGTVLLHGMAGTGKTAVASEFARWYALTGGIRGPVAMSSLSAASSLSSMLRDLRQAHPELSAGGAADWDALDVAGRRAEGLRMLGRDTVLWVCDGLDPPSDRAAASPEWHQILEFVNDLAKTSASVVLVSRQTLDEWLGETVRRVELVGMSHVEQVQFVRAVEARLGVNRLDPYALRPLLELSTGAPGVLVDLVERAVTRGVDTRSEADDLAREIRAGSSLVGYDPNQLLSSALALASPLQRRGMAVLHLFQGFADVGVLEAIADPGRVALVEVNGLDVEAWMRLLDTVAAAGFARKTGPGAAVLHPALPGLVRDAFESTFASAERRIAARRAFAEAMASIGTGYAIRYKTDSGAARHLEREEHNLSQGLALARTNGWWRHAVGCARGLRTLYLHLGRGPEWVALVEELRGDFIDPNGEPLSGREDGWHYVTDQLARIAVVERRWERAEALERLLLTRTRKQAAASLEVSPDAWRAEDREYVSSFAFDLEQLAHILKERESRECFQVYREVGHLYDLLGNRSGQGIIAFNLSDAHLMMDGPDGLDEAQHCAQQSLDLTEPRDRVGRAKSLSQLGAVQWKRAHAARRAGPRGSVGELESLEQARQLYHRSLDEAPADAPGIRLISEYMLGLVYDNLGAAEQALEHLRVCTVFCEQTADWYYGGLARRAMATILLRLDRDDEALEYARAAASYLRSVGRQVADLVYETDAMVARLEGRPLEDGW